MSKELEELFSNNRAWAAAMQRRDPDFFTQLSRQQSPKFLWIGCADSRVPANEIVGLKPGELFVHRNVANLVVHSDLNCQSVVQFAVDRLKVDHIIVCGHYGCSGVQAASENERLGMADAWLSHLRDVATKYSAHLDQLKTPVARTARLCELNVLEQAANVARTTVVLDAWERGQQLTIHGWIYAIENGLLRNLEISIDSAASTEERVRQALKKVTGSSAG